MSTTSITNQIMTLLTLAIVAIATLAFTASPANAQLSSQLGILDLNANGGINPATGNPWEAGDKYRFIFASSLGRDATSTNIADYNNFIQARANASTLGGVGVLGSVTWNALGSTETVDARDNTNTNINVDGPGESIWLLNGTEIIANDYADFYPNHANGVNIDISETGGAPFDSGDFTSVWTGSNGQGQRKVNGANFGGDNWLGSTGANDQGFPTSNTGLFGTGSAAQWIDRFGTTSNSISRGFYGLSEVLTVSGPAIPEPSALTMVALGLLSLSFVGWRRRQR